MRALSDPHEIRELSRSVGHQGLRFKISRPNRSIDTFLYDEWAFGRRDLCMASFDPDPRNIPGKNLPSK